MHKAIEEPEQLWEDLLSRQPGTIKVTYSSLNRTDQKAVLAHLRRMVTEPGWQPEQRVSAKAALDALLPEVDEDTHGNH